MGSSSAGSIAAGAAQGAGWGSMIGPIGTGVGALLGGVTSAFGLQGMSPGESMARQYEASMNMFKEQLKRGPAWEMAGLKAAGLHPYLRYGKGGSSTPISVHQPSPSSAYQSFAGLPEAIGGAASSAVDAYAKLTGVEKTQAEIVNLGAQFEKIVADTSVAWATRKTEVAKAATEFARKYQIWAQENLAKAQADLVRQSFKKMRWETLFQYWSAMQKRLEARITAANVPMAEATAELFAGTNSEFLRGLLMYMQAGGKIPFLK